ncbi:hypothetical protein PG993_014277 [Apiospora rasikravindrae]|uniref:F-box domain-containing protein n=1 Tax=Apiospora rasikravindrae TaxID=990691 RepID=A0ABR1RMC5_9PEZI
MSTFLSLPRELRDQIYELCLLHPEPFDPWSSYGQLHELTLGLFRLNKAIHTEACSLFYAHNHFDFTSVTAEKVVSFLEVIGRNAGYIRHVLVDFPEFLYLDPGDIALVAKDIDIIASLQRNCTNLSTLTTSLHTTHHMEIRLDTIEHPKVATEALKLVDTHFKSIPSLQDIIVEVYEFGPNDYIRRQMVRQGWTISTIEEEEDRESKGSWPDYDDYDYDGYSDDGDYDVDNDSDYWRRTAD